MSPSPSPSPDSDTSHSVGLLIRLSVYTTTQSASSKKKSTKKEIKTKEFQHTFTSTKLNYLEFMTAILEKHHINSYNKAQVTERQRYTCKIQVPPAKQSEACNVENFSEYEDVVGKILDRRPTRPITVFVNMKDIEKAAKKKDTADDTDDDSDENEELGGNSNGLSKIDTELARYRGLLEKKYANDHDTGYTYIDAITSDAVPLTPFMMKEWAHAMYDGTTSVNQPPQTPTFDVTNRQPSILRGRSASVATSSANTSNSSSDLAHISQILSSVASMAQASLKPPMPTTPTRITLAPTVLSPIQNTPSKLRRFLAYTETHVGVRNAQLYRPSLELNGYGPDILHLVDNNSLTSIGITAGDAIRLKQNTPIWWNSADAKRKRDNRTPSPGPAVSNGSPPNKKFTFEKRFHDGGGARLYGPRMISGNLPPNIDFNWFYYCQDQAAMVPVPPGMVPELDGDDEEESPW